LKNWLEKSPNIRTNLSLKQAENGLFNKKFSLKFSEAAIQTIEKVIENRKLE